jgi:hypothetical protein
MCRKVPINRRAPGATETLSAAEAGFGGGACVAGALLGTAGARIVVWAGWVTGGPRGPPKDRPVVPPLEPRISFDDPDLSGLLPCNCRTDVV